MNFEKIDNPYDLLEFMSNIEYGYITEDGEKYRLEDEEFLITWKLTSPVRLIKKKCGNCFDRVELERYWFSKKGYKFKTFFIIFQLEEANPFTMHSFLVYEDGQKFYYFDSEVGIEEFSRYLDAVEFQLKRHIVLNNVIRKLKKHEIESLHVYLFDDIPYDIDIYQYMDEILDGGILYL